MRLCVRLLLKREAPTLSFANTTKVTSVCAEFPGRLFVRGGRLSVFGLVTPFFFCAQVNDHL